MSWKSSADCRILQYTAKWVVREGCTKHTCDVKGMLLALFQALDRDINAGAASCKMNKSLPGRQPKKRFSRAIEPQHTMGQDMQTAKCFCEQQIFVWPDYRGQGEEEQRSQGKDLECLAGTRSRRVCHAGILELYPVGSEERHVQIRILQRILRRHHGNELEGPKSAMAGVVCQQLQSSSKENIEAWTNALIFRMVSTGWIVKLGKQYW